MFLATGQLFSDLCHMSFCFAVVCLTDLTAKKHSRNTGMGWVPTPGACWHISIEI